MSTTTIDIQQIPTKKIAEVPGFNPRGDFARDDEDFLSLKASIASRGIESPIKVGPPGNDGIHPIIFGHRRHAAALELGLDATPALVDADLDEKQRFLAALAENRARAEMTPIAEAKALKVLREDFKMKQADAAAAMAMSERSARNRERLLEVPESVQALVTAGEMPLEATIHLAPIACVRPRAVELIVEKADPSSLVDKAVVGAYLEEVARDAGLQQIAEFDHASLHPNAIGVDSDFRKRLKELWDDIPTPRGWPGKPNFHFGAEDAKKAKAAGALFEFTYERYGSKRTVQFISDPQLTFELAKMKVPAMDKEARRLIKEQGEGAGPLPAPTAKQLEKEERERARAQKAVEKANLELADKLGALANPKATDVEVVRLVCAMALGMEEELAEVVAYGLGALDPAKYSWEHDGEELYPDRIVLEELAAAKSAGDCLKVYLRVAFARHFVQSVDHAGQVATSSWNGLAGPSSGDPLDNELMLDALGERLGLVPAAVKKQVKERRQAADKRTKRREDEKAAAEALAAKAQEEAGEDDDSSSGGETRTDRALALIKANPGIVAAEIASAMKVKPNYLYRILGDLEKDGKVEKDGRAYTAVEAG